MVAAALPRDATFVQPHLALRPYHMRRSEQHYNLPAPLDAYDPRAAITTAYNPPYYRRLLEER